MEDNPMQNSRFYLKISWNQSKQYDIKLLGKSGAYCCLKILLGYIRCRKTWIQKAALSKVRIYASAQNLFTIKTTFTKVSTSENSIGSGASCYPLNKTFIFGLNVNFN